MKNIMLLLLLFASPSILLAQTLTPQVVSTGGGFSSAGGHTLSHTQGQLVSTTLSASSRILTQGFQQPVKKTSGLPAPEKISDLEVILYPNPTADFAYLQINSETAKHFKADVMDLHGKILQAEFAFNTANGNMIVNLSNYPSGIYFIRLFDLNAQLIKIFKLQKINR